MNEYDIAGVQHVAKTSWNDTYNGIIPQKIQDAFLSQAYSEDMLKFRMEHSPLLIAEEKGKIVGFINTSLTNENGEAELLAIYLLPNYQRKGIGKALLQEGILILKNVQRLFVNVESDNQKGHNFYAKRGFQVIDVFNDDFDGHTLNTTKMLLNIS
ncbi:GNAT family N-acetyltransferase [Bacillus sp. 1780r2a1]|nr:GNAT family N-acetyltransferase [Priestia flexa]MDT2048516.1 GNAT family N-acetyltransferase [Priestia flexa]MDT2048521.1 GNAT family N-acetyltransferase [Priestia flexa]MEC0667517.1 GNAT family N-acetyltransferase [Priestia flexa]USY57064.1 GNAT family N-acetyltransferase [Bacillus sp. 1780r2a1]